MKVIVCPARHAALSFETHRPSHVLGLLAPGHEEIALPMVPSQRLELRFNDIAAKQQDLVAPDETHLRGILNFGGSWDGTAPMLIYCFAGISRSTAAAFSILCQHYPAVSERGLAQRVRKASPSATPNPLMIAIADRLLGRQERMSKAIFAIGRGEEAFEGEPFELALESVISR